MEIKTKPDRRGWELDQLNLMSKVMLKILRNKRDIKKDMCNKIYRDIIHLMNIL